LKYFSCSLIFVSIVSAGALQAQSSPTSSPSTVVAEVNGLTVTLGEFEKERADALYPARRTYYEAERKLLEQVIDERLIEIQARKENLTPEQLLDKHVNQVAGKDPTDDQLKAIYDTLNVNKPFDDVKAQLRTEVKQLRIGNAKNAYIKQLRSEAKISVTLPEPRVEVAMNDKTPIRGSRSAPVMVVEFADFQCPYCKQLEPQLEKLKSEFGDKIAIAFKDFPLPAHVNAQKLAEVADCAGEQGKYWDFHDYLFNDMKEFDLAQLKDRAKSLSLDSAKFNSCVDTDAEASKIKQDVAEGTRLSITGTPTLFINGRYLSGSTKYETLRDMVQEELSAASSPTRQTAQR